MDLTSMIIESRNRFTPRKLAPNMWLDASDPTTLYDATVGGNLVTNGGTVARWEDKSGNARHATQGTSTRRPRLSTNQINNKNAILFTNTGYPTTDTFMNAGIVPSTMASNHTVFAVFKCMGPSLDFANETAQGIFLREGYHKGLIIDGLRNQFPTNVVGNTWPGTSFSIQASLATADLSKTTVAGYSMELTPTIQINLRVNNNTKIVTSISTSPHNLGNVYIGRATAGSSSNNYNWPFNGYICELLYFTRVLTDIERTNLTYYLYDKWGIPLPDPDAAAYFARIEAAGSTINPNNRNAVNTFIVGCKADGIWNSIKASCILAGADTLSGALVPLVGTAPTNVGFLSGDYSRTTGLIGDGSTKYLNSNRANNADPQDNAHLSVYISTASTSAVNRYPFYIGAGAGQNGESSIARDQSNGILGCRSRSVTFDTLNANGSVTGFVGHSRSLSVSYSARQSGSTTSITRTSQTPIAYNLFVFATSFANGGTTPDVVTYSNSRISFYSIGESINLALLDTRITKLMNSLI